MTVRVRFAPSPTGFLHVGSARAALFNWLVARHHHGSFILRSDDTDRVRSEARFQEDIESGLRWLGLEWDEGVGVGGPHGSYRQGDRFTRYEEVASQLVGSGAAYEDFCTAEEIDRLRQESARGGGTPVIVRSCDALTAEETERRRASGVRPAVRFEVPRPGNTTVGDVVRGEVSFDHAVIEDFVILRSDGSPTYHLASTVDDVDYGITHVIRGEDLLPSTPKHLMITAAMGAAPPVYAHLPLLHGPDGKKLSKRHGDTALRAYRDAGILAEAMANYLALLGWSPGEDETIVPLSEMVTRFDLAAVSRNPAVFDPDKLEWMNGVYIRSLEAGEFVGRALSWVEAGLGRELDDGERDVLAQIAPLVQERAKSLADVADQVAFLFADHLDYDAGSWEKVMTTEEAPIVLAEAGERLARAGQWTASEVEGILREMLDDLGLGARRGFQPLRVAVTGSSVSPPLFESMEALGRDRTLQRLAGALANLG